MEKKSPQKRLILALLVGISLVFILAYQNCGSNGSNDNSGGTTSSSSTNIVITSEPSDLNVDIGDSFRLTVLAKSEDDLDLTYSWYKDGVDTGVKSNSISINSASEESEGYYHIRISNGEDSIESRYIQVQVGASYGTSSIGIEITKEPQPITIENGETGFLDVQAEDDSRDSNLTYQWYRNGSAISGAQQSEFYIENASEAAEGYYYVLISKENKSVKSNTVFVTVEGASCPSGSTEYNGHCYIRYGSKLSYYSAAESCRVKDGYLARVTSSAEQTFLIGQGFYGWIG